MDIGRSLRMCLAKEGKSQEWLAEKIETSRPTISNYCANKGNMKASTLQRICDVFGLNVSEFIALGEK